MKGIKVRLTYSYFFIILLTVSILEGFIIITLRSYYYDNINQLLIKEAEVSSSFYNHYISTGNLDKDVDTLLRSFSFNTSAQIQILDANQKIIGNSIELPSYERANEKDVAEALSGHQGYFKGNLKATGEPVVAVSRPLKHNGQVVGVIRFISSLEEVNLIFKRTTTLFVSAGILIVILVTSISLFLSNTIINPVHDITWAARQMSSGNFRARAVRRYDDEIGDLADTLNYMAQEITIHEELKNEFISSVSHELRTPLTSIKGWAVTLRSGDLNNHEEILEGLEIIENESDRLSLLLGELLDFSKFESGKISIKNERIALNSILEKVYRQMKPRADRLGIELNMFTDKLLPTSLGDEGRLKQVFINLLDNSLKFTRAGGHVNILGDFDDNFIYITIEDNGIGIPKSDLPKVMEKFFKGEQSLGGSGIGLSVCSEIISLHGGKIEVSSLDGEGSSFRVILPR